MSKTKENQTSNAADRVHRLSPSEKRERKQRILTKRTPAIVSSIADAVVIKDVDIFFLARPDGNVPLGGNSGFGLYYHDCRFLNGYELKLGSTHAVHLASTTRHGFKAEFQLSNPDIRTADGRLMPKDDIGIRWERTVYSAKLGLYDVVEFTNYGSQNVEFHISLTFQSAFEDVFAVRGLLPERLGKLHPPSWQHDILNFLYDGADHIYRGTFIHFSPAPDNTDGISATFRIALQPQEKKSLRVSIAIGESANADDVRPKTQQHLDLKSVETILQRASNQWVAKHTGLQSDSVLLNETIDRSLRDLDMLRSTIRDDEFFAAGVPWFTTLFGRDSIITSLQTLAYDPNIAEQTLRLLASYQGRKVDEWRDEQPGKILHELRIGELSNTGEIPYNPYYGTVDATPLFLILVCQHANWTGSLSVFNDLRSNIERALKWMSTYGDFDNDGYLEYKSASKKGLINQGWKDSGDAIVNADGSLATPPISLVEVQGYAYLAKISLADLYERVGETDRAESLRKEAEQLRLGFNRDFWLEDKGYYALALQDGNMPAAVVSSNPGQALWTGIIDKDKAQPTVEKLMAEDMFSGWGVRTLSAKEKRYNPIGYHLGTVWPHDNSLLAAGFRRYGFDDAARKVIVGIIQAATHFGRDRLPELFSGFSRDVFGIPVRYPVACHPQAWAAGSVLLMLETALGLMPEAFHNRLRIVRPMLPHFVDSLDVKRMRVGDAHVDLAFRRRQGRIEVEVLNVDGRLEVAIEDREKS